MHLFCFGFGYSAEALAHHLSAREITIAGTRTSLAEPDTFTQVRQQRARHEGDAAVRAEWAQQAG